MTAPGAQESGDRMEIRVRGGMMPVWLIGQGPPLLLLHGISANHTEWLSVARLLMSHYRVILPDLLGRGESCPEPRAGYSLTDEVDRLLLVLKALGVQRPLVAGHSHGATLALTLASRVACPRAVLVSPVTPWTKRPKMLDALRWSPLRTAILPIASICRRPLTHYILTRRVYGDHRPNMTDAVSRYSTPYADRSRARALLEILADWQPSDVARLKSPEDTPVIVTTGEADRRIAVEHVSAWADELGAEFTAIPGAGHGLTEEKPDLCARIICDGPLTDQSGFQTGETDEHQE